MTDTLARAFDDDPVMNYLVKQDARRAERLRRLMRMALNPMTFPYGETYVAERFEGVALWNPPGQLMHGLVANLRMLPLMAQIAGLSGLPRALGALGLMEAKHPKEPHYYLLAIGVDPAMQGRGVGSQLMAPMLERCDREHMPAYLESSKARNVPLYERHDFEVVEELPIARGGPLAWRMWRKPR